MQDPYFDRRFLEPCQGRRYCGQESEKNQKDSGSKSCVAWRRDDFSEEITEKHPCSSEYWEDERQQIEGEIIQGIKKNLFTLRTARQSNIPREDVQSSSLEGFKTQMDKALSNLV